ncbi:MAG: transglycosylase domain-containing protein [Actinomycetota bacterium]|nr:transglycosylase domain-containing protein [Actinomycetota bacterium]
MDQSIHLAERRDRRGRRLSSLSLLAVVTLLGASLYGLFAFLETNTAFGTVEDVADSLLCDPAEYNLSFPALGSLSEVETSDGVLLGHLTLRNSQPVSLEEIPVLVRGAVISAEDGEFFEHEGIDFRAIARTVLENARTGRTHGGSTITQQIVKKTILSDEITIERKICEAVIAAQLERIYTKDQILEFYMNSQFFGANAYGVKAAAQEYFGKDLDELTVAEAATIVVPIRGPSSFNPRKHPEEVIPRRDVVIDLMAKNGYITQEEATAAKAEPLAPIEHEDFAQVDPRLLIEARERLLADPKLGLGATYRERSQMLFGCPQQDTECEGGGGLKITITVDYEDQQEADRLLRSRFRYEGGPTAALAMVENETGAIRVISSGLDYGDDFEAGQRDYDLAVKGRRQAGSSFKPFALIAGLENGSQYGWDITLGSWWDYSSPQKIDCGFPCSPQGNIWTVSNAGGGGHGVMTLEQATYTSKNTVYAQVSLAVGPERIVDTAHKMGIESPLQPVLSIALGTQTVSPLEMASAYSTIANFGELRDSYLIERIEDADGNLIYQHETIPIRVLDEALTAAVVRTLEKVPRPGGTARLANIGRPQFGKTGTAQNFRDVWFVGAIPQYTTAVWVGHADAQIEMVGFKVYDEGAGRDQAHSRAYGGTVAGPVWADFMEYITADLPVEDFPDEPEGTSSFFRTPKTDVPDVRGLSQRKAEDAIFKAGLRAKIEMVASTAPKGEILEQTPSAGSRVTQGGIVTVRISNGIPPLLLDLRNVPAGQVDGALAIFNEETGLDLSWTRFEVPTNEPSALGRVIRTEPGAGATVEVGQNIKVFIGVSSPPAEGEDPGDGD